MVAPIRVLLADDSEQMRRAVCTLLADEANISVCAEARDYGELLLKLGECSADVALMDLRMPGERKIDAATVKAGFHGACLLAMSFAKDPETISLAESFGAFKLLDKIELFTTLIPAIHECVKEKLQHA